MNIKDFARLSGVKESTIRARINDIKGHYYEDGEILFTEGSRYPFANRLKVKDSKDRYYAVLLATSRNKYIDEKRLNISRKSFNVIIDELIKAGLLVDNGTNNEYGANAYDLSFNCVQEIDFSKSKKQVIIEISKILGRLAIESIPILLSSQ